MTPQMPTKDPAGGGGTHIHTGTDTPTSELGNVGDLYIKQGMGGDPASIYISGFQNGSAVAPLAQERQILTLTTGMGGAFHLRDYFDGFPYDSNPIAIDGISASSISDAINGATPTWWVAPTVTEYEPYPDGTRRFLLEWGSSAGNRPTLELYDNGLVYGLTDQQTEAIYEKVESEGGQWEVLIDVPTEQAINAMIADQIAAIPPAEGGGGSNLKAYWKTSVSASANSASSWTNIGPALPFNGDGESAYEVTFRVPTVEVSAAAKGHIRVYDEETGSTIAVGHFETTGKRPAVIGGLMLPFSDLATLRAQIKFDGSVSGTLKADSTMGGLTYPAEMTVVKLGVPPEV